MPSYLFRWLAFAICAPSLVSPQTPDRHRLSRLYEVTNGPIWRNSTNWNTTKPVCSWFGVECANGSVEDDTGVTSITLPSNGLVGRVDKIIYEMQHLKTLNLKDNSLTDAGFEGLLRDSQLESIVLSENGFTHLTGIGNAPDSLQELNLEQNRLKGSFPVELAQLTKLKRLLLNQNQLHGSLPTVIGSMSKLDQLFINGNKLTGKLPSEIGLLGKMEIFTLSENAFTGTIPTTIERMSTLQSFSLHNAALTGALPPFRNMPFIKEIFLDYNKLEGTIPRTFLEHATTIGDHVHIGLSYNNLTGTVPKQLERFTFMDIDLVGNQITHIPDEICKHIIGSWMSGLVGQYGCDAILCSKGTYNQDGRQSNDENPCVACPSGKEFPYLGATTCSGETEMSELDIIMDFYASLRGPAWVQKKGWTQFDISTNTSHSVTVDVCSLHGITCNDNNTIEEMKLSNNGLIGTIPTTIFQLKALTTLDVSRNAVTLTPEGLEALSLAGIVSKLNIASTHSIDLAGIGSARSIRILDVSGIDFGTPILAELFNLVDIEEIYARFCYFTGKLPTQIGNLDNLIRLELFNNELTGSLPTELGRLSNIRLLDLAENKFVGGIPTEFGRLTQLHKLHLHQSSGTTLNGTLPAFDTFPDLVELSLDSNSFSGAIPSNFMSGVSDKTQSILIDLSFNELVGSIPIELNAFSNLTINLEGNKINSIPLELCSNDAWMNGEVGKVGSCDAILCPTGTWNLYGKASFSEVASCLPCASSTVYGSTSCGADEDPFPEKTILDELFKLTGGERYWNSSVNWTDSAVGICYREGITCMSSSTNPNAGVTEIRLPMNGLGGIIPPSIFDIPNLRVLDFSENEVDMVFSDIAKATNLEVLEMTNTKLESLAGIDKAPSSLYEMNFAQNQMAGPIASELFKLSNAKTLLLGNNLFSGTIPSSIAGLSNIVSLDISQNEITGLLPSELGLLTKLSLLKLDNNQLSGVIVTEIGRLTDLSTLSLAAQRSNNKLSGRLFAFSTNPVLSNLDLRDNAIAGLIPVDFLSMVSQDQNITVNLSGNDITGAVPVSLDRFQLLDIDLTGNEINDLPGDFCDGDNGGWMDGKVGELGGTCDAILCRPGTAAEFGRQIESGSECQSCPGGEQDAPYFGATKCTSSSVESERTILMSLYESLNGTNWIKQENWMSEESVCTWYGVTCDNDEKVISLELRSNNLDSEMDVSALVFSLSKLATLDLRGNSVIVDFQRILSESELVTLKLSSTGVNSLDGISFARKLHTLELSNNFIVGVLPDEFFSLTSLEAVYLSSNMLSGTLSSRIGNLKKLVKFFADGNDFSGTIPSELGLLSRLDNLVLSDNLFSGLIPSQLGSLPNLEKFSAHRRSKPGPRLSGTLPAFDNAPLLTDLYLDHNDLEGTIPSNFLSASPLASLIVLSHNGLLNGTVPVELDSISALDLQLEGNRISKVPNEFCDNSDWMDGALGRVGCDAFLCPPGTANLIGRANDTLECVDCISPDAAMYYGSTSCDVSSERRILLLFYQRCGGIEWYRRSGWATDVDLCDWTGISCHSNGNVKSIDLSANNLVGTPPSEIFELPRLESLVLSSNPISFSFKGIENARRLTELRLDSTGLSSLEGLGGGLGLTDLNLRFNNLQGTIMEELFALTNLRSLNLANNKLESTLPTRFAELRRLRTIRLGSNEFTGPLPPFSHAFTLTAIDLSFNRLSGKIPKTFLNRMSSSAILEVNLASNMLTGDIPVELDRFLNLTIYLRDNRIDDIPKVFCDKHGWNGGDVEHFGCNAILCAPGTFNTLGRQSTTETPCLQCHDGDTIFYGRTVCSSAPPSRTNVALFNIVVASVLVVAVYWI